MKEYLQALHSTKQSTQKIHNIIKTFSCLPLENAINLTSFWVGNDSFKYILRLLLK